MKSNVRIESIGGVPPQSKVIQPIKFQLISISVLLSSEIALCSLLCHVFCLPIVDDHSSDLPINDKTKLIGRRPIEEDDPSAEKKRKGKISKIAGSCFLGCGLSKPKTLTLQ